MSALALSLVVGSAAASNAAARSTARARRNAAAFITAHGYRPLRGIDTFNAAKAASARWVASQHPTQSSPATGAAPSIGASWDGVSNAGLTPPDANGAIGPNSYLEIINVNLAIYNRSGGLITTATLSTLTGHSSLSDPMILWDPDTQRFYYNVWDTGAMTMEWGFSKDANPTSIPGSFCNYTASFGYNPAVDIPDYPKLGQTKDFLMIGVNHYPSFTSMHADRTDLLWIDKPQGSAPVTTCPAQGTFGTGIFKNLKNGDGTTGFTPVPAIQTDPSSTGYVLTESDIECPDICGTGMRISVHAIRPDPNNPLVPQLQLTGKDVRVNAFAPPADAPQSGSAIKIDTLDGRLEHAVSGIDPSQGNKLAIWTGHAVLGGAGSVENWYEINPTPTKHPSLFQTGTVSDASLWVYNGAASPDRTCTLTQCAHGDAMVLGFTTSSSATFPAVQMVSKIGAGAQSGFVMVHASTRADIDFGCAQLGYCRWGDYGGATSDPAASLTAAHGEVWLSQQYVGTNGSDDTWNWEALP